MSFILDALRKSENERREQATPTLGSAPQAVPVHRKKSVWLPVLVVILTLNAIGIATLLLMRDEMPPVTTPAPAGESPEAETATEPATVMPAPEPETAARPDPVTPVSVPEPVESSKPVVRYAPQPEPAPTQTITEGLPSFAQLKTTGEIRVDNLRIDMHVYSDDPAKRMVFINMNKYREGDRVKEGPTVEEITPEGVVLNQLGRRFRLDRK